jgi:hypothetical protein
MKSSMSQFLTAANLLAVALIILLGSNLIDLFQARNNVQKAILQQEDVLARGSKIEGQLNTLASGTKRLATSGNANAQRIVAVLNQNGVNIKSP